MPAESLLSTFGMPEEEWLDEEYRRSFYEDSLELSAPNLGLLGIVIERPLDGLVFFT